MYKHYGYLSGLCFLGVLISGGMTENGRIDLFSGAAIMLALLTVGMVSAKTISVRTEDKHGSKN